MGLIYSKTSQRNEIWTVLENWTSQIEIPDLQILVGGNLETYRFENSASLLHAACILGNAKLIRCLVDQYKFPLDIQDKDGLTPLDISIRIQKDPNFREQYKKIMFE